MTGTISFGGIGSGLDTEGIVQGLIGANSGKLNALKARVQLTESAVSTMSSLGQHLSSLSTAATALSTVRNASAYAASSSSGAVVASVTGSAFPGSFDVDVLSLAKEQRTYSKTFDSNTESAGQAGTIEIGIGAETATIDIEATDSLEAIATKINAAGVRATASTFFDGTSYRLQIRGLDTGAANALTFTETGTDFDLNGDGADPDGGRTHQAASDAQVRIDGFTVTRSTNQISGAIPGVTLAVTAETTESARVTVATDTAELQADVQKVVDSFNMIISGIHVAAGFGDLEASNEVLSGDYALRTISDRLGSTIYGLASGSGSFNMLAQVGLSLNSSGKLSLDAQKLTEAVSKDAAGVAALLAEKMASLDTLVDDMRDSESGVFALRQEALSSEIDELESRAEKEEAWLDRYGEQLRKRFTQMDVVVGSQMTNIDQLLSIFG